MVKIGEVEYLVKFDTLSKSFADTLREAIGDEELLNTEEIENKLIKIEGHLGLLVTPFSGNRMVDLIKSKGYLAQFKDPQWIEAKVEAIASHRTLLKKMGIKEEPGTEEAKEKAEEKFDVLLKDMADFIKVTMASDPAYFRNLPTLQDIVGLLTTSTEGNLAYLIEKIMDKLKPESEVDKAVYKWLKEEMKITVDDETQRIWDELAKKVKPKEGEEEETIVKTYQDFLDLIGEKAVEREDKDKIIKEILHGDPTKPSKQLVDFIRDELKKVTFGAGLQVPRVFRKGLEKARELEPKELYDVELENIKNDIKFILRDINKVKPIVEKLGDNLKQEQKEKLIERAEEAIREYGWYFFSGESKTVGDPRKLAKETKRQRMGKAEELFTSAQWGPEFSKLTKMIGSQIPVEQVAKEMEETSPKELAKSITENTETMEKMFNYVRGLGTEITRGLGYELEKKLDDSMKQLNKMFGE